MSRLIVKNLPIGIKEERLKSLFGKKGEITDCTLKYTKDGRFRKFAFIGFGKETEANDAVKTFNKTFIDTSRIQVEYAMDFGDGNKPRAWSKYSKESSAFQDKETVDKSEDNKTKTTKSEKKKTAKDKALDNMMGELQNDPKFEEFLEAHLKGGKKQIWSNDATDKVTTKTTGDNEDSDADNGDKSDSGMEEMEVDKTQEEESPKKLSDLDYLKSKMSDQALLRDSDDSDDNSDKESDSDDGRDKDGDSSDKEDDGSDSIDEEEDDSNSEADSKNSDSDEEELLKPKIEQIKSAEENKETEKKKFVIKLRGFTGYVDEKTIREFFHPLKANDVRIPRNAQKKPIGVAFIDFRTEKEWDEAMRKNKLFIGSKRIFLKKIQDDLLEDTTEKINTEKFTVPSLDKQRQETAESEAAIADTGRLYVRNLPYICKEEDIEALFSQFGPLTETHLPIDSLTKKLKGFAFVTYMIPEHAVRAFSSLDGTCFMGRMLHILSAKPKDEDENLSSEGSTFKTQKQAKQKAMASSSHNWNTLFLGANAVANVMAEKYGTEKSQILDAETSGSLGVRMALGETQIVSETRDFLTDNGVVLDSFSQSGGPRSKTVMLVKNLPSGTKAEELHNVFSKHGTVGRVILPPSGITAIIEFFESTEAKLAYKKLAYTKFQHVPLYLEWAPTEALKPINCDRTAVQKNVEKSEVSDDEDEEEEESGEPGSTLFVKNLNFDTTDESLKQKFEKCGKLKAAYIAKKKDLKNPGKFLSMGYGFVEYIKKQSADKALKTLQHTDLDGHHLELKISNRASIQPTTGKRKKQAKKEVKTSKILVRNVPFEAQRKEIFELFKVFGELKSVRLPKKLSGTGSHRGFAFVDFLTRQDAKRAFEALCHSTHLYGRRLVLEWAETAEDLDELRKKTAEHFHEDVPRKKMKKSAIMEQLESSERD